VNELGRSGRFRAGACVASTPVTGVQGEETEIEYIEVINGFVVR